MNENLREDHEFETYMISAVVPHPEGQPPGWSLTFVEGFGIYLRGDQCSRVPEVEDTARLYGKGLGYPTRGIVLTDVMGTEHVYHYQTAEEYQKTFEAERAEFEAAREAERPEVERQRALRAAEPIPHPETREELDAYLTRLMADPGKGSVGYEASADAARRAAVAAFNFMAGHHGLSGFQASWASLQILRDIRDIKGPFGVVDGSELVYPSGEGKLREAFESWIRDWKGAWARDEARKKLAEHEAAKGNEDEFPVAEEVLDYWHALAAGDPPVTVTVSDEVAMDLARALPMLKAAVAHAKSKKADLPVYAHIERLAHLAESFAVKLSGEGT